MSMISGIDSDFTSQDSIEESSAELSPAAVEPPTASPVIELAPDAGAIAPNTLLSTPEEPQPSSISFFIERLKQSLEALKVLSPNGFRQVYPVFMILFSTIVIGISLSLAASLVDTINHIPVLGGIIRGLSELIGLVAVTQFIAAHLLFQQKRAELFARIVVLKKDILGQ